MLNRKNTARQFALVSLLSLVAGCSSMSASEDFSAKENEVSLPNNWSRSNEYVNREFSNQLLALVNQPELTKLVQQSLAANYDLRVTAARLKQARLLYKQADISQDPSLNTSYKASRSKDGKVTNSHTFSLDLSWEIDIWGRLADATDAASASAKASELDYQYARNSLVARVIQAWLDIHYRQQIITVEQQWVTSLVHTQEIIREQVLDGEKEQADLDTAKASTERTRANLIARKQTQASAIRSLNVLLGHSGNQFETSISSPISVAAPPIHVPAEVIGARPDLIAAYQRIVVADKNAAAAYKELLPKFTLTASASHSGKNMSQLLDSSSAWNLLGGITAPLFNRDSIKNSAHIKSVDAEIAYLEYQKLLLNALTEVENSFDQEASLKMREDHLRKAYVHSFASMHDYQNLYQDGVSGVLTLLVAKQSAFQAKIELLEIEQARFSNRITLALALGMGV